LAERTREEEARARVDAERLRIAREVHDTIAHAIAIINVQSGVTAHVLDKRPERARETLVAIEQTSSQALREMRAILGVLRDTDNGASLTPVWSRSMNSPRRHAMPDSTSNSRRPHQRRACRARWAARPTESCRSPSPM
jgi:nitrate/nitrite-specific signal transduction histidine kinase